MQQQEQSNGWAGAAIGGGIGSAVSAFTPPFDYPSFKYSEKLIETLSNDKAFTDKLTKLGKTSFWGGKAYNKAFDKVESMRQKSWDKSLDVAAKATVLYRLGLPLTAALIGSTLTD